MLRKISFGLNICMTSSAYSKSLRLSCRPLKIRFTPGMFMQVVTLVVPVRVAVKISGITECCHIALNF